VLKEDSGVTIEQIQSQLDLIFRLLTARTRGWEATLYREIADKKITAFKRRGSTFIEHAEIVRYNRGVDPLAEIIPFLREVMNHVRCPMLNKPTCPMNDLLRPLVTLTPSTSTDLRPLEKV